MSNNPYVQYYRNQAGSGITGFQGTRYQRGHGFFSKIFSFALPILKQIFPILGKQALNTGVDIAQDVLSGNNFRESSKSRLKEAGSNLLNVALDKLNQKGSGRKKRRSSRKKRLTLKSRPRQIKRKKTKGVNKKYRKRRRKRRNFKSNFLE
jgi:hypothetical protein